MVREGWPATFHLFASHDEHPLRDLLAAIRDAFRPPKRNR